MKSISPILLLLVLLCSASTSRAQSQASRWTLSATVRIGALDGPNILVSGGPVLVSGDRQSVYVGQRDRVVRVFDISSGHLVRTIGREGQGPGDFQVVSNLGWRSDTLWVSDRFLQRVSFFTREGALLRTEQIVSPVLSPYRTSAIAIAVTPDGTLIGEGVQPCPEPRPDRSSRQSCIWIATGRFSEF